MQNVHFSPVEIGRMVGVNESTVKRWVDSGLLPAFKTSGGHRRIRESDLQAFMRTREHGAHHSYHLTRLMRTPCSDAWRTYYTLHLENKHREAQQYVTGFMLAHGSAARAVRCVIAPALVEIGSAWHRRELDIADEHRMTFRIRGDVYTLETLLPAPAAHAPGIVLACVPEENHELALGLLALSAHEAGWEPMVLGINVPHAEVERAVRSTPRTRVVVLSKLYQKATDASRYVRTLARSSSMKQVTILLVGGGWSPKERASLEKVAGVRLVSSGDDVLAHLHQVS